MLIRYVIGRPTAPLEPKTLKRGGVSRDLRRDTTLELYLRACKAEEVEPKPDYVEHLRIRDAKTWAFALDMWCTQEQEAAALYDASQVQAMIAKAPALPPKNGWHCERCRWRSRCDSDPMIQHLSDWPDVIDARAPTQLAIKYGRTRKVINRDRRGFVLSPSEMRSFLQCPRLWYIEHDRRKMIQRHGPAALPMLRGTLTHEAIRLMTDTPGLNMAKEVELMVQEMAVAGRIDAEAQAELSQPAQIQAIADRATEMHAMAMRGVAEVVEHEQRRIMRMPGSKKWVHGIPDAVVRMDDGRLAVIEYKTTSTFKDLSAVADRYRTNPAPHLYAALVMHGQLTF